MKLNQIQDFVALADHGGIRAAARARGISQPVVTKSVQALESELGVALVHPEVTVRVVVRCESFAAMVAIVARSDMFGVAIREMVTSGFARDLIDPLDLRERISATNLLFTRTGTPLAAPVADFLKLVRQSAKALR